jgi:SAM-dependent methyltransferase
MNSYPSKIRKHIRRTISLRFGTFRQLVGADREHSSFCNRNVSSDSESQADPTITHLINRSCWVCACKSLTRVRETTLPAVLMSDDFKITDKKFGSIGALDKCRCCGFFQCTDLADVAGYYVEMDDTQYEATRKARALQELEILKYIPTSQRRGRLLDIGAGSGILIEQAKQWGLEAIGIEPSIALQARAAEYGLRVHLGTLPHADVQGPFDIITMVDVIEHVPDPVDLLRKARELLAPSGILLVTTPDRRSVVARLMRWKWWHYRIAHIGYFDAMTLATAVSRAGFEFKSLSRPGWRLPASYLIERVTSYGPDFLQVKPPAMLDRLIIPLNFRDSILAICLPRRSNGQGCARTNSVVINKRSLKNVANAGRALLLREHRGQASLSAGGYLHSLFWSARACLCFILLWFTT